MKPSGLSRGRGIRLFSSLTEILTYVISSDCGFVAQKYIENAALIFRRRFDIRQWVVVTGFEKIEFLFWDEFYTRICSRTYEDTEEALRDSYRHLANNSINKAAIEQDSQDQGLQALPFHNNIASLAEFQSYIQRSGVEKPEDHVCMLKSHMINIVAQTLLSTFKKTVESHPGSFLILGFDFMLLEGFISP